MLFSVMLAVAIKAAKVGGSVGGSVQTTATSSVWEAKTRQKKNQACSAAASARQLPVAILAAANEEMSGANVNVLDTTKSAFKSALENIEKALIQWDNLLSESASPDRQRLRKAATELDNRLDQFKVAHAQLFAANTTPPYIKYEVLATVKAVSEKVGEQFRARVTAPTVMGMYSRIIDVPRSTPKKAATQGVKEISSSYQGDLNNFWDLNMGNILQQARRIGALPNLNVELKTVIYNTSSQHPIADSLNAFRDSYKAVNPKDLSWIDGMSSSVAEITFRILKYQNAVEQVFDKYKDNDAARRVRDDYRKLFDTVTQYIQNRVEVLQETMS